MPIVQIQLLEGRTDEQKENIIAQVTEALVEAAEVSAEQVRVIITEFPAKHWGIAGKSKHNVKK
ncbi:4-oxalocrotonate tautomerase [Solibacillus sp. R5-41]|uniref:4-oxalocrotonate tautomerase n=1 Tax=Solibacillus sp. R5-41 TaxID=2048654 RepID=UPI000C128E4D|nr:4-oxalocrotonate tautomerase [Solibacillus sp. R5-41]ATP41186.1 4-oxalocrotonate tautomerase [Solibacillus sp. R5-41]